MEKNILKDFNLFSKDLGVSSMNIEYYNKMIENSLTPYVLEERMLNITQIDVFSRLMMERIIWVAGPISDKTSTVVQAQLMFLDSLGESDITLHIDSPGGSVKSGLSIIDVMDYVNSDIRTINTGMAASMGSLLLGAGTKGKRSALRFSRTMLHQSSGGFQGNIQDAYINMKEWENLNNLLFDLLSKYCNKPKDVIMSDAKRDFWLSSQESVEYGIVDEIVTRKKNK